MPTPGDPHRAPSAPASSTGSYSCKAQTAWVGCSPSKARGSVRGAEGFGCYNQHVHTVLGNSGEGRLIRACLQLPPGSLALERCRISGGRDRGSLIYGPCAIRTSGWCWVTVSTSGKLLPLHLPSTHLRKPRLPVILPLHRQYKPQPPGEIGVPRPRATCSLAASQAGVCVYVKHKWRAAHRQCLRQLSLRGEFSLPLSSS